MEGGFAGAANMKALIQQNDTEESTNPNCIDSKG